MRRARVKGRLNELWALIGALGAGVEKAGGGRGGSRAGCANFGGAAGGAAASDEDFVRDLNVVWEIECE